MRGDAPEALPLDSAKGTFEKRIGARANSAKSLGDIRVPPATFACGKFAQLGTAEL